MGHINALQPEQLCQRCDPDSLDFNDTSELEDLEQILGQARAVEALHFGLGIRQDGYNIYAMGSPGTGKHTVVQLYLGRQAEGLPPPDDWCYINNFRESHRPHVLRLPAGQAVDLQEDMEHLIEDLQSAIPTAFESENYNQAVQEIQQHVEERNEEAIRKVREDAESRDITLIRTPGGFTLAPMHDGKAISNKEYDDLSDSERKKISDHIEVLEQELNEVLQHIPAIRRETQEEVRRLNRDTANAAVQGQIGELRTTWEARPQVCKFLDEVQENLVNNAGDFRRRDEENAELPFITTDNTPFRRYMVNVLVDNGDEKQAPIIYETHPTYLNLTGRVEHRAQFGTLITDFTMIKPGSLHRANGGFLLIDAHRILQHPYAWEGLKRTLQTQEIRIESLEQMLSLASTSSLEPEPIPLDVKVVILGNRMIYYLLHHYDPDFGELFKVSADFEEEMERTPENNRLYARLISSLANRNGLIPFTSDGVARVIEQASRYAGETSKLSIRTRKLTDLLREADFWAREAGKEVVSAGDVEAALERQTFRSDRIQQRMRDEVLKENILVETAGEKIGQINGLSVIKMGENMFGQASRITANVRLGSGDILDIEREVEMGGPIHSKGVLILSGLLGERFARERPLSLHASLVFEQNYGGIEGDSASSAELYALLSALAEVPIRQSLAVTGSVNQKGEVQSIGGVNEKIEGFFELCQERGLSGDQGVLIPASNVQHLMLKREVVEAVEQQQFSIYPITTIDEGIALLTGATAGERDSAGDYPADSINGRVDRRLDAMAHAAHEWGKGESEEDEKKG